MTVTKWRTPDNTTSLFLIKKGGGSIAEITDIFKNTEPDSVRPACPLLLAIATDWHEQPSETRRLFHELYQLIHI